MRNLSEGLEQRAAQRVLQGLQQGLQQGIEQGLYGRHFFKLYLNYSSFFIVLPIDPREYQ